jgi:hypothetical protein
MQCISPEVALFGRASCRGERPLSAQKRPRKFHDRRGEQCCCCSWNERLWNSAGRRLLPYERRLASGTGPDARWVAEVLPEPMTRCYRGAKTGNRATSKLSDYVAA